MKISLTMIVKNEEEVLGRCLESVAGLFDEIVIADTGSVDRTKEIAGKYTEKVLDFDWQDDFSAARNFAISRATGDYIMWLDADDVIEGDNKRLFRELFDDLPRLLPDVVMLPYNVGFEGDRVTLSYDRERVIRVGRGLWFSGRVHEAIAPAGRIIRRSAAVSHRKIKPNEPGRNLRIYEKMLDEGMVLCPRDCYYLARELAAAGSPEDAAVWYGRCIDNPKTWEENRISAMLELSCMLKNTDPRRSEELLGRCLLRGSPRADALCEAGARALERGDLRSAAFWYNLAPGQYRKVREGFVHADFGGRIPYSQLRAICDALGEHAAAEAYGRLAGK